MFSSMFLDTALEQAYLFRSFVFEQVYVLLTLVDAVLEKVGLVDVLGVKS